MVRIAIQRISAKKRLIIAALALVCMYLVVSTNILSFSASGEIQTGAVMYIHADAPVTVKAGEKFEVEVALLDQAGERITGRRYANGFGGISIGADGIISSDGHSPRYHVDLADFREKKDTQGVGIGVYKIPVTIDEWPADAQTDLYKITVGYVGEGVGSSDGALSTAYKITDAVTVNRDNNAVPGRVRYAVAEPDRVMLMVPESKPTDPLPSTILNIVKYRIKLVGQAPAEENIGLTITGRAAESYRENWLAPTVIDNTGAPMKATLGNVTEEEIKFRGEMKKTGIYDVDVQIMTPTDAAGRRAVVSFGYAENGITMPLGSTINFSDQGATEEAVPNVCFANPYIINPPRTPTTSDPDLIGLTNDGSNITHWTNGSTTVRLEAFIDNGNSTNVDAAEFFIDQMGLDGTGTAMMPVGAAWNSPYVWVYFDIPVLTLQGLSEGSHDIYIHGREAPAVTGPPYWGSPNAQQLKLFIDRTPPSVTIARPAANEYVSGENYKVQGSITNTPGASDSGVLSVDQTLSDDVALEGIVNPAVYSTLTSGTTLKAGTTATLLVDRIAIGGTWTTSALPKLLADQTISADATLVGTVNIAAESTLKSGTTLKAGTTATSSTDTSVMGGSWTGGFAPIESVQVYEEGQLAWMNGQNDVSRGGVNFSNWLYQSSNQWDTTAIPDGSYALKVRAVDAAGNISTQAIVNISVDNTAPYIYFVSPTDNQGFTASSIPITVTVNGTGTYTVDWGEGANPSSWTEIGNGTSQTTNHLVATKDVSGLADGPYTLRLTGIDSLGNTAVKSIKIYLDHVPPSSTILEPPDGSYGRASVTFTGTAADAVSGVSEVKLRLKRSSDGYCWNGSNWLNNNNTWVASTITSGQGTTDASWQYAWTISSISSGDTVTVTSKAKDVTGLEETPGAGRTVTVDTTAPTINWGGATPGQWYTTAQAITVGVSDAFSGPQGFRWNWNADPGDLLSVDVGNWRLNEGGGSTAADASTYANTGTMHGTNYWTNSGMYGHAFDGSGNDYMTVANSVSLNSGSFSIEMWERAGSLRAQGLASKLSGTHGWRLFMVNTGGIIEFDAYGDVANIRTQNTVVNTWYHIVATYDAPSQTAMIYLNGVFSQQATPVNMQNTDANGLEFSPNITARFYGRLDEIKYYNRALSADEIVRRYMEGASLLNVTGGSTGTTIAPTEGKNTLYVWGYNNAGNSISDNNEYWYDPTAPGGWDNFTRTYNTRTPNATIQVSDATSGLNVATGSAQYSYSTNGGSSWSAWNNAPVTGTNGTTDAQTITAAAIPFPAGSESNTLNYVKFRIWDVAGNGHNTGQESQAYLVDNATPTVSSIVPAASATNVEVNTVVKANFTEKLLSSSLNTTTFKLYDTTDDPTQLYPLAGSVTYVEKSSGSVLGFFTPTALLHFGDAYRIVIMTGVYDAAGNHVAAQFTSNFTTAGLGAALVLPSIGQAVNGTAVAITGTANGTAFYRYSLEYGVGASPVTWLPIGTPRTTPVTNNTLGAWNVSALGNGVHTIRLRVIDSGSGVLEKKVKVWVDNTKPTAAITLPAQGSTIYGIYNSTGTSADTPSGIAKVEIKVDAGGWVQVNGGNRTEETGGGIGFIAAGAGGPWTLTANRTLTSNVTLTSTEPTTIVAGSYLRSQTVLRAGTTATSSADTAAIGGTWTGTGPYTLSADRTLAWRSVTLAGSVNAKNNSRLRSGSRLNAGTIAKSLSDKNSIGGTYWTSTGPDPTVPWTQSVNASASGGTQEFNSAPTASVTFSFTGTAVTFISTRALDRGRAKIYIDGTKITDGTVALSGDTGGNMSGIDLFSDDTRYQERVYTKAGLTNGAHTIKVEVVGDMNDLSQGTRVDVDAFEIGGSINWNYSLNATLLSFTSHTMQARATDRSGLVGDPCPVRTFTVSAIPTCLIKSPVANDLAGDSVTISGIAVSTNFKQYDLYYGVGATPTSWYNINTLKAAAGSTLKTNSILKVGTIAASVMDKDSIGSTTWTGGGTSGYGPYVLTAQIRTTPTVTLNNPGGLLTMIGGGRLAGGTSPNQTILKAGTTVEVDTDKTAISNTASNWTGGSYTLNRTRQITAAKNLQSPELTKIVARSTLKAGTTLTAGTLVTSLVDKNNRALAGASWGGVGPYELLAEWTTPTTPTPYDLYLRGNIYVAYNSTLANGSTLRAGTFTVWAPDRTSIGGTWQAVGPFTLTVDRPLSGRVQLEGTVYVTDGSKIYSGSRLQVGTTTDSAADKAAFGGTWTDAWTGTGLFTLQTQLNITTRKTVTELITVAAGSTIYGAPNGSSPPGSRLKYGTYTTSLADSTAIGGTWTLSNGVYTLRGDRTLLSTVPSLAAPLNVQRSTRFENGTILRPGTTTDSEVDRIVLGGTWARSPYTLITTDRTLSGDVSLANNVFVTYGSTLKSGTTLTAGTVTTSIADAINFGGTWTGGPYTLSANQTTDADRILANADPTPIGAGSTLNSGTTLKVGTTAESMLDTVLIGGTWTGNGPYTLVAAEQTLSAGRTLAGTVNAVVDSTLKSGTTLAAGMTTASWEDMVALGGAWTGSGLYTLAADQTLTRDRILAGPGKTPVEDGTLGTWLTSGLLERGYSVKLVVTDNDDTTKSSTVYPLVVDHTIPYVEITSPMNMDYISDTFTITGTAKDYVSNGIMSDISLPGSPDLNQIKISLQKGVDSFVPESVDLGAVDTLVWNAATTQWEWTKNVVRPSGEDWGWFSLQAMGKDRAQNPKGSNITYNCVDDTPPPPPVIRGLEDNNRAVISLSWTPVKDAGSGIDYYEVMRDDTLMTSDLQYYDGVNINTLDDSGKFYGSNGLDTSVVNGTSVSHDYKVRAVDYLNQASDWSNEITIKYDGEAPSAPSGLTASTAGSTTSLYLGWTASTDDTSVTQYKIYRTTSPVDVPSANPNNLIATTLMTGAYARPTFFDGKLTPSTTYRYQVVAYDASLNMSAASNIASGTAGAGPSYNSPHGAFATDSDTCVICHRTHTARGESLIRELTAEKVCYSCHDGTGSANATKEQFDYAPSGGHRIKDDMWPNAQVTCVDCHTPHGNPDHASFDDFENDLNVVYGVGVDEDGWTAKAGLWNGNGDSMATVLSQETEAGTAYIVKNTVVNTSPPDNTGLDVDAKGGEYAVKVKFGTATGHAFFTIGANNDAAARSGLTVDLNVGNQTMSLGDGDSVIRSEPADGLEQTQYWYRIRIKIGANKDAAVNLYRVIDDNTETRIAGFTATVPAVALKNPPDDTYIALGTEDALAQFDNVKVNDIGMLISRYRSYHATGVDLSEYKVSEDNIAGEEFCLACHGNPADTPGGSHRQYYTGVHSQRIGSTTPNPATVSPRWLDIRAEWKIIKQGPLGPLLKGTNNGCLYCHGYHGQQFYMQKTGGEEEICWRCHGRDANYGRVAINIYQEYQKASKHGITNNQATIKCTSCHGQRAISDRFSFEGYSQSVIVNPANIKQSWSSMRMAGATVDDFCTTCHQETNLPVETHTTTVIVPYTIKYPPMYTTSTANGFVRKSFAAKDVNDEYIVGHRAWTTTGNCAVGNNPDGTGCHSGVQEKYGSGVDVATIPEFSSKIACTSCHDQHASDYSRMVRLSEDSKGDSIVLSGTLNMVAGAAFKVNTILKAGTIATSVFDMNYIGGIWASSGRYRLTANRTLTAAVTLTNTDLTPIAAGSKLYSTGTSGNQTILMAGTIAPTAADRTTIGGTWSTTAPYRLTANRTITTSGLKTLVGTVYVAPNSKLHSTGTTGSQAILNAGTSTASLTDKNAIGGTSWADGTGLYTLTADKLITTAYTCVGTIDAPVNSKIKALLKAGTTATSSRDIARMGGEWTGTGPWTLAADYLLVASVEQGMCLHCHDGSVTP